MGCAAHGRGHRRALGLAAEREMDRCKRANHERVGLQAFGTLMRDLTALHHRQQAQAGVSSLAATSAAALGPEATLRATRAFRRCDRDGSGDIDFKELRPLLRQIGLLLRGSNS